jgi:hypothetical protein
MARDGGGDGQVSFSFKASAISVNVTPKLPRRFIRGSLARAQATLPLNAYASPPITIDPLTSVPGDGTRINSAQKPPAETSLVKAVELTPASPTLQIDPPAPAKPWVRSLLPLHGDFHNRCPPRFRARGAVRLAIVFPCRAGASSRLSILAES